MALHDADVRGADGLDAEPVRSGHQSRGRFGPVWLPVGDGIGADRGRTFVSETWRTASPVMAWLDDHVGPTTEPPTRRR
ncbi:hypothetical protein [Cryptosporangium sp. NPDC048952]|uniref:hypothetical protein n=1 Tax=Cryptosporangium sp. NPDC048952 TaxID=3363961 RepID=UPI003710431D